MLSIFNKSPIETIGVDRGRDTLKAYSENGELIYPAVVGEWHKRNLNANTKKEENEYDVIVDNEKYFIGKLALKISDYPIRNINADKINEETKILTLVAVALSCKYIEPRVSLTVSLPIDDYNDENQQRIIDMLKGKHAVTINQEKIIKMSIENVYVVPEGLALLYYMTLDNQGKEIEEVNIPENFRILDAGSMTHNLATFKQNELVDKKSATFTIKKGLYYVTQGEREPNEKEISNFVRMLMTGEVALKWSDYDPNKEVVFGTGGGMFHEGKFLKEYFPSLEIIDNPLFGTAIGCFRLGAYLCQQI